MWVSCHVGGFILAARPILNQYYLELRQTLLAMTASPWPGDQHCLPEMEKGSVNGFGEEVCTARPD